jgi:hypothetical protein
LNQAGDAELGGQQAATLKSVLSFWLLDKTIVGLRRTFTVGQLQNERRIYDPFLIVSYADESCYIEV